MYNGSVQQRSFSLAVAVKLPYSRRNPSKSLSSLAPLYFSTVALMLWYRSRGFELGCAVACRAAIRVVCAVVCAAVCEAAICETVSCSVRKRSLMSPDARLGEDDEDDEEDEEDEGDEGGDEDDDEDDEGGKLGCPNGCGDLGVPLAGVEDGSGLIADRRKLGLGGGWGVSSSQCTCGA